MTWASAVVVFGGTMLVLALTSRFAQRAPLSPVLGAFVVGAILGPHVFDVWPDAAAPLGHRILERIAEVTVAFAVTDIAVRVGWEDLAGTNRHRLARLLGIAMPGMWLTSTIGAHLVLGMPWPLAALVGAIITPTDPAVAASLASGALPDRLLPERLRATLELESGANDGLAIAFVSLGVLATAGGGSSLGVEWVRRVAVEVVVALVLGVAIGWVTGRLAAYAVQFEALAESYVPLLGIAMTVFCVGFADLVGASSALTAFSAGIALTLTIPDEIHEAVARDQEALTKLSTVATFLAFGVMMPWGGWSALGWPALGFAVWVLILRRPPVVPLAMLGDDTGPRSTALLAAYGPLGAAAVYYALHVETHVPIGDATRLWAAVSVAVTASVIVHAGTASWAVRRYAQSAGTAGNAESAGTAGNAQSAGTAVDRDAAEESATVEGDLP